MYDREQPITLPETFNFPFKPYEIQQNLMEQLFQVIENKQIGIFESPTGTGKTLTLTCAALTWLMEHEKAVSSEIKNKIESLRVKIRKLESETLASNDWITRQYETIQLRQELTVLKSELDALNEYNERIRKIRSANDLEKDIQKYIKKEKEQESDFVSKENAGDEYLIQEADDDVFDTENESNDEKYQDCKIFFCSRTHSQLSQVIKEVKRTVFGKETRTVALASRQNYCINPEVKTLKSSNLINEKCLELQKNKSKARDADELGKVTKKSKTSNTKCPFNNQTALEKLRNESITKIMDIEDLVHAAKNHKACPYYSSRLAAHDSQIIMVPYQMILHKKTRIQLGINIKGSVLVIDEAHNLIDTISAIHSADLSLQQLCEAKTHLDAYKNRYLSRFSAKTVLKINQLLYIAKRLINLLKSLSDCSENEQTKMISVCDLISEAELFNLNLVELCQFAEQTYLAQKVHGFHLSEKQKERLQAAVPPQDKGLKSYLKELEQQKSKKVSPSPVDAKSADTNLVKNEEKTENTVNAIRPFLSFLESLLQDFEDGRILLSGKSNNQFIKYLVLNPGAHFSDLVQQCRAIILAGGTMQPITEFTEQLFSNCKNRVQVHSYGHVVSKNAVLPLAISHGPTTRELLFNFSNKNDMALLKELSSVIVNVCNVVPAGVVCFFSSYEALENFHQFLKNNNFLKRIEMKKRVFVESRRGMTAETLLEQYSKTIRILKNNSNELQNGALLLSVVGGKLSEGLNFSDDLGRCVVVVGLPYPNKFSPELIEKMKYLDAALHAGAGKEYYENLCMKAVNQSIGRAVRHINDFASVILLDARYSQDRIRKKLPAWIEQGLQVVNSFGKGQALLVKFFKERTQIS